MERKKILILEDNPGHVNLITHETDKHKDSFSVDFCTGIAETLSYLKKTLPDLLVCDWKVTDGQTDDFLDDPQIKNRIPLIYMSSHGNEELAVSLIKRGAREYFIKNQELFKKLPQIFHKVLRDWENFKALQAAETKLIENEQRFRSLAENLSDVIWMLETDLSNYKYISPSIYDFLGYAPEEIIQLDFLETLSKESKEKLIQLKAEFLKNIKAGIAPESISINLELEFIHKEEVTKWGEVKASLVTDSTGEIIAINGITRDITEKKITEQKLKIQEVYFKTLIREAPLGLVVLDNDDRITQVNKHFLELFEYKEHECLGVPVNDLIVPSKLKDESINLTADVSQGKTITTETQRQTKSGKKIHVQILGKPVALDNNQLGVLGIYQNISERKETEAQLKRISERLILATQTASIGIWDYDTETRKLHWEAEMFTLHDLDSYDRQDLMKRWEDSVIEKDKALLDFIFNQKEFHKETFEKVYRIRTDLGKVRHIRMFASVIINPSNNKASRILGCCWDITNEVENAELSKQVEVSAKVANIKQQFLANMSHEIRSPMTGILGMAELLMKTNLDEQQMFYTKTIKSSSDGLLHIVNDILDFSKIEAGKMKIKPDWFNLKERAIKLQNLFFALAKQKDIELFMEYDQALPEFIFGDENRISQIVTNLVSNAIKFTNKGHVKMEFILAEETDNHFTTLIKVSDTGIGISETEKHKLFNIFSQIDNSDTRNFEGVGLGLSISQRLAELMKTKIEVSGEYGKGSCFSFSLNSYKADSTDISNQQKASVPQTGGVDILKNTRVLLVEDKKTNQMVISMMLKELGCQTDIASNGLEALDMISPGTYDIVLMDIQMPLMDGLTAVRKLRAKYKEKELPYLIGLSAKAMEGDAEYYISRGMNDYLTKPVSGEILEVCLEKWIEKKRLPN